MDYSKIDIIDLPVIDLSFEALVNPDRRMKEAEKLVDSLSGTGFCLVTGIEGYHKDELFKWTKWFFNEVPEEVKVAQLAACPYNPKNTNLLRGYFPLIPQKMIHHECYDIGMSFVGKEVPEGEGEGNPFREETPKLTLMGREEETDKFYEVMYHQHSLLHKTAHTMMSLIAEAGGENSDFFAYLDTNPLIRPTKYPKRIADIPENARLPDGRILSSPPHVDSGLITLLQTFGFPGLEIQVEDKWYKVSPSNGELVVNVGEQLTEMSNGRFKSTIHRVIDIEQDRYSVPFFCYPAYNANINTKIPRSLLHTTYDDVDESYYPFAAFYLNKFPIYAKYAGLIDRIPEWVRKKYLEGFTRRPYWALRNRVETDGPQIK